MRSIVIITLAVFAISHKGLGQVDTTGRVDTTCTYDTCALRLKHGFWSRQLVRGIQEEKVAGFGLLAPDLSKVHNPDGSPNPYLAAYRGHANKGTLGLTLGLAAMTIGFLVTENNETAGVTLVLTSFGFTIFGGVHSIRAHEDLSRGVWLYNSKFAASRKHDRGQ